MEQGRKVYAVIVAAGSGSRFGANLPKQFCLLCGRPVVMTAIERMRRSIPNVQLRLVLSDSFLTQWQEMCDEYGFESPQIVVGGSTRWESVKNAIASIPAFGDKDIVLVHDAARPLMTARVAVRLIAALDSGFDGAVPVVPVVDSIREIQSDGSSVAVDRSKYRAVQTPQAFLLEDLRQAYEIPFSPFMTDDASVMEAYGLTNMALVEGENSLMKITRPGDMEYIEYFLKSQQ